MQLIMQIQKLGSVAVIRCRGRIVTGDELRCLQLELEKLTPETKNIVLQLAEVSHMDSGGLGALVRLSGMLRAAGGGLRLCQLSPFVLQVLQATSLLRVLHTYESEREAIEAFSVRPRSPEATFWESKTRIVCVDTSGDLLAYVNALLSRSGYEVFTTRNLSDARTLLKATKPSAVICGPGIRTNEQAIEKLRQIDPKMPLLLLQPDFSTAEASQAGLDLVGRVQSLLKGQQ